MATTLKLPFARFTCQTSTGEPRPKSSYIALMGESLDALKRCQWNDAGAAEAAMPPHDFAADSHLSPSYDAFHLTGNYSTKTQKETVYAGMVAYRFTLPAAYRTGSQTLVSAKVPVSRDRFLRKGVRLYACVADSATPAETWDGVRGSGDTVCEGVLDQSSVSMVVSSAAASEEEEIALSGIDATKRAYLWIYLTLEDYEEHWTQYDADEKRLYAVEGAAMVCGSGVQVTFSADVTEGAAAVQMVAADRDFLPKLVGDVSGVFAVARRHDGGALDGPECATPASCAKAACGLSAVYSILKGGGANDVPVAVAAADGTRPGAAATVRWDSAAGWRAALAALLVPCAVPGKSKATAVKMDWDAVVQTGGRVHVWICPGVYSYAYPADDLSQIGLWDASSHCVGAWTYLGSIADVAETTSATFALPDVGTKAVTFLFTAWIDPEEVDLSGTFPQGVGTLDVDLAGGTATGTGGGFRPSVTFMK